MKRILAATMLAVILSSNVWGMGKAAEEKPKPTYPESILVVGGKKEARFNHASHQALGMACGVCHHDPEHQALTEEKIALFKDTAVMKCASCHNDKFETEALKDRKAIFHARCKECHRKGYADKKGPTNCNGCHGKPVGPGN